MLSWRFLYFRPVLCEDVFVDCERFMESLLEKPQGRNTLKMFFEENDKFVHLLLLSANQNFSLSFVHRILKFVSRTLETCKYYYFLLLNTFGFSMGFFVRKGWGIFGKKENYQAVF